MTEWIRPAGGVGQQDVDPFEITKNVPVDVMVPEEVADVPGSHALHVDNDKLLQVAKIMIRLVEREESKIIQLLPQLRVEPMGNDPVSTHAATAWNLRLLDGEDSYRVRVLKYLQNLRTLVDNLLDTARANGYTEEQISAMMDSIHA